MCGGMGGGGEGTHVAGQLAFLIPRKGPQSAVP